MISALLITVLCACLLIAVLVIAMRMRFPSRIFSYAFWRKIENEEWESIKIDAGKRLIEVRWVDGKWTSTRIRLKGSQEVVIGNRSLYIGVSNVVKPKIEDFTRESGLFQRNEPIQDKDVGEFGLGGDWWKGDE